MGDSEMVGAVAVQAGDHTPTKKKHHNKEKRNEAKHDPDLNVDDDNEEQDRRHPQNNEGGEQQQQLATKKDKKKKKLHSKAREEEESVQKEKDGDVGDVSEDEEEEDDGRVEEEVVVPAEEQRTTAATERKRRGTVSLYDMVAAEGNTIRRDATEAAEKNESDEEEAEAEDEEHGGSGKKAERTKANATTAKNEDDSSDSENEGSGLKSEGAKKVESGNAAKGGSANKERELALKAQKEKEREERERERKKEKELMREKKEKERKERERREKEKLKEKERKREEKEKKKKEKLDKKAAAKEKLKETKDAHNSAGGVEDLSTTSTSASASATAGGASAAAPRDHGPAQVSALPLEGRRSSGHEDEAQALAVNDDDSEDPAAADDYAGPGSPQARYKDMMAQKYANVSSDPNGYRAHMTTSYFSKLAEQRRIKRSREEALKKIKHLNPRDYQAVKKAHERLLKEAREARRRRVKEGGPVAGKGRSGGLHLVMSDLGPAAHASDEAAKVTAETDGGEVREKAASAKILAAAGRRSKFTKKYANSMPDMDRQAIRAGLKEDREEKEKAKTKAKSDKKKHGEEEEKAEDEEDEEEAVGEGDEEEDEDADEPHEGKAARLLNSSKSAPKAPLSPKSKKSTPDKDGAVPIDPEEFFDELYAICSEEEPQDEVEKYLFVGRLLRDHELHKQEREQRLKRMIGLQTSENGSTLWKESEDIFHKPLSSFVCHRDFARLVRKYQIERPAGEILCGPFDNAEMPKTEATYTVLVTLAMALDDTTLSENIQTNFKRGEYFKTDDDLSDPTGLKVFFDEVIGEHTPLMRILKVTSQSIVAPCITKLKACMAPLDFNSVRNSWSIAIAVDNEEVTIVHTKKETATPDSEEKYGPFTFEWAIEYVFDLEMTSLKYLRPMLMNVRGSKKSRKVLKKAYTQLVSVKAK